MLKVNVASGEFIRIGDARVKIVSPYNFKVAVFVDAPRDVVIRREDAHGRLAVDDDKRGLKMA